MLFRSDVDGLRKALGGSGFHDVSSEEGDNAVDLAKVTYMRVLPGDAGSRIGFGGA